MIVKELIEKLSKMPQDAAVVIEMFSECRDMDSSEPILIRAEDRKLIWRNGKYITWSEGYAKSGEIPMFVTVCHFPGN